MNQGLYIAMLTLALIVLAAPLAILFGYTAAAVARPIRDWIRWIRLRRRANRLLLLL